MTAATRGSGRARMQLTFAAGAVLLAAADTYVVVLALTAMMGDLGVSIEHLQKATPILSGFLVGYVAVLPLLGRLSDLYGRAPVLAGCLLAFAVGSLITASAPSLGVVVAGRTLQGLGGGGLVPVTLALVADMWPADRRAGPLGVIGAVQEVGSVAGPLYGAAILAVTSWRAIFWVNLPVSAVLAGGLRLARPAGSAEPHRRDGVGGVLLALGAAAGVLVVTSPRPLTDSVALGGIYTPLIHGELWLTPLFLAAVLCAVAFVAWEWAHPGGRTPLVNVRGAGDLLRRCDWQGSALLTFVLATIVISFSAADPAQQVIAGEATYLLPLAAIALLLFVIHERRTAAPLIRFSAFSSTAAWGALVVNLFIGAALMAALIDVPIFARTTVEPDSQFGAAMILLRFLVAVPIGAVIGGFIAHRAGYRVVTLVAMVLSATMFVAMTRWTAGSMAEPLGGATWIHTTDVVLAACGLGFGLAIAPVNAAMLAGVEGSWHGLASALVVVARSVGMLVGLSVLTAAGLHHFYEVAGTLPPASQLCPASPLDCPAYDALAQGAIVEELHLIFMGAAVCCAAAAVLGAALLRRTGKPA